MSLSLLGHFTQPVFRIRIGDTLVIAKRTSINQQVERSLVPIALPQTGLNPVKPQVLHPRLAELRLIRCQTSLNSLIYGANFGHYLRVTDSLADGEERLPPNSGGQIWEV